MIGAPTINRARVNLVETKTQDAPPPLHLAKDNSLRFGKMLGERDLKMASGPTENDLRVQPGNIAGILSFPKLEAPRQHCPEAIDISLKPSDDGARPGSGDNCVNTPQSGVVNQPSICMMDIEEDVTHDEQSQYACSLIPKTITTTVGDSDGDTIWLPWTSRFPNERPLNFTDKNVIIDGKCLNDAIINRCQNTLAIQRPDIDGFQNVLFPHSSFTVPSLRKPILQVLPITEKHVVLLNYDSCDKDGIVKIYDSKPSLLLPEVIGSVCKLIKPQSPTLKFKFMVCSEQENNFDCAVHSIANATAIVHGYDPSYVKYCGSNELRTHLCHGLEAYNLNMFPHWPLDDPRVKLEHKIDLRAMGYHPPPSMESNVFTCAGCRHISTLLREGILEMTLAEIQQIPLYCKECTGSLALNQY